MSTTARSELGETRRAAPTRHFCSYCGYPPPRTPRRSISRVCTKCHLGVMLRAPANAAPRPSSLFLIFDKNLVVQGVSRGAEAVLLVDEPDGVNVPLGEFLMPAGGSNSWGETPCTT